MKPMLVGMLAGAFALGGPPAAIAADFTVIVPVQLINLPEGARPQVTCRAIAGNDSNILGIGEADVDVGDSSDFSGTVVVSFDLFEGSEASPADATGYSCGLLAHPDAEHVVLTWERCEEVDRDPASNPLICGARGAPVVGLVEGAF